MALPLFSSTSSTKENIYKGTKAELGNIQELRLKSNTVILRINKSTTKLQCMKTNILLKANVY